MELQLNFAYLPYNDRRAIQIWAGRAGSWVTLAMFLILFVTSLFWSDWLSGFMTGSFFIFVLMDYKAAVSQARWEKFIEDAQAKGVLS